MPVGISVNKIPALESDIAMRIATSKKIMIQAPIPGRPTCGVEIPNAVATPVKMKELFNDRKVKEERPQHAEQCQILLRVIEQPQKIQERMDFDGLKETAGICDIDTDAFPAEHILIDRPRLFDAAHQDDHILQFK